MLLNKTLIIIADGYGVSSSWGGNAILASKPKNLEKIFNSFPNVYLSPSYNDGYEGHNIDIARLLSGNQVPGDREFLSQEIENGNFYTNENILSFFDNTVQRSAGLHLIGNIPLEGNHSDINHLEALIRQAKRMKIMQIYLHLIVDQGSSDFGKIGELLQRYPFVELATLIPLDYLIKDSPIKKFNLAVNSIVQGAGHPALSFDQAKSFFSKKISPISLRYRGNFRLKMKDFDSILFFNHDNSKIIRLITTLSQELLAIKAVKFTVSATFFDPTYPKLDKLHVFFKRKFDLQLLRKLGGNCPMLWTADLNGIPIAEYLFDQSMPLAKKYFDLSIADKPKDFFNKYTSVLKEYFNEYEVIFLHLPFLNMIDDGLSFKGITGIISELDKFIGSLSSNISNGEFRLIFSSANGGAEKIGNRDQFERLNSKTRSFLPFILVEKGLDNVPCKPTIYDMIGKQGNVLDIAPTILDLMNQDYSRDDFAGNSLKIKLLERKE